MKPLRLIPMMCGLFVAGIALGAGPHPRSAGAPRTAVPSTAPTASSYASPAEKACGADQRRCLQPHYTQKQQEQLHQLRSDALKLQQHDGGKLTEGHQAMLQARLDAILNTAPAPAK